MTTPDPSLTHTREAVAAWDLFQATAWPELLAMPVDEITNGHVYQFELRERRLGEAVGEAFGLDTCDINNIDTCRGCVRPGPWLRQRLEETS